MPASPAPPLGPALRAELAAWQRAQDLERAASAAGRARRLRAERNARCCPHCALTDSRLRFGAFDTEDQTDA